MSTGALILDRGALSSAPADIAQSGDRITVGLYSGELPVWDQVDQLLRLSLERAGFPQTYDLLAKPQPSREGRRSGVVVAPGIMMSEDEYEERFGKMDIEYFRGKMSPQLFKTFVRYIGSIPGDPDLDVNEIATTPE